MRLGNAVAVCVAFGIAAGLKVTDLHARPSALSCDAPANRIVAENCKEGSLGTEWEINAAGDPSIQGFATRQSYAPGEKVVLKVKTNSTGYRVDVYRVGYYRGRGARKVAADVGHAALPQAQPECLIEEETLLADCGNWAPSAHWQVPGDAVSGVYFARLTRTDAPRYWRSDDSKIAASPKFSNPAWDYSTPPPCGYGYNCTAMEHAYGALRRRGGPKAFLQNHIDEPSASHVYFVVREPFPTADVLFQTSDTTWHAYNTYLTPNTYGMPALPHFEFEFKEEWRNRRSYKRSYNVPMITRGTRAINMLFHAEYPMIRWLERNGYSTAYWSGVDTDTRKDELLKYKAFLSVGHDEYWSGPQRRNVEAARDAGVGLAFLSGNEVYWKIRWEPDAEGNPHRTMVVYKESQASAKIDPSAKEWTGTWRDSQPFNPEGSQPENSLTGTIWTVNAWRNDALEVPYQYSRLRFWRHTEVAALKPWQKAVLLRGLLGHEWDEDIDNGFRPKGLIRMSETTVHAVQKIFDCGATFDTGSATHHLTLYRSKAGSLVFGAGTVQWSWGLDEIHDAPAGLPAHIENEYDTRIGVDQMGPELAIQQATVNLFKDMGVLPSTPESHFVIAENEPSDTNPPTCSIAYDSKTSNEGVVFELTGTAEDDAGVVAAVEVTWDGGATWHPAETAAASRHTGFVLKTPALAARERELGCRAADDSCNTGQPTFLTAPADAATAASPSGEEL
ncbi:hypothetical protein DIPPA_23522 [Diplonema papillatum]|nr:hypothetical protein DIPPA_23522 [Diplonema papillatum]|eukprot:gene8875-13758_t